MKGIIYVLINEAMEGYVKIGRTTNLEQRIKTLDNTSTPLPFECVFAVEVDDCEEVERNLHDGLDDLRVRKNREFFEVDPFRVISLLQLCKGKDVTPKEDIFNEETEEGDKRALEKARKKRENFNFAMVDIPEGAELTFVRDDTIKAKVIDNKYIEYQGEQKTLSGLAKELLGYHTAGPFHWVYKDPIHGEETLQGRRERIEKS